jgi:hypothetical protein
MSIVRNAWFAVVGSAMFAVLPAGSAAAADPGTVIVSIYYVATGKQVDFLKWAAEQESLAKEAGIPASQWYAHQDGDAWDYIGIGPATTPEQDKKLDEVSKKHGKRTGMAAGIVLRQYISRHTDTYAYGPVGAADLLKHVTQ